MELTNITDFQDIIQSSLSTIVQQIPSIDQSESTYNNVFNPIANNLSGQTDMDDLMNEIGLRIQRNGG